MISANNERNFTSFQGLQRQVRFFGAGLRDFFQVLRVGRTFLLLFRNGNSDVAGIFHVMASLFEARFETSNTDRGWLHVYASAGLAQVEWHADDPDFSRDPHCLLGWARDVHF